MTEVLEVEGLTKNYRDLRALDGLSFTLEQGERRPDD